MSSFDSRVEKIYAVGSMSMQNALLSRESAVSEREVLDILFVGSNTSTDLRRDWAANYEAIAWLVQIANACPQLKVGIKHHQNCSGLEARYGSRVILWARYEQLCAGSRLELWCLTPLLIYEMISIGRTHIFGARGENTFINRFVLNII